MDSSDKKQIPLSIEKCEFFKPKSDKKFSKKKLSISLNSIEESEQLIASIRKASTDSTSNSKTEDASEINNINLENINIAQELSPEKEIFFGRDKNCSNPIYNFYQSTEEYFQEKLTEKNNYKKSRNYLLKNSFLRKNSEIKIQTNNSIENKNNQNINSSTININNNISNTNTNTNSNCNYYYNTNAVPALMGAFFPKMANMHNGNGKGKFDSPMYYIGFYGWESK